MIVVAGLLIMAAVVHTGITLYLEKNAAAEIEKTVKQSHLIQELGYQRLHVSLFDRKITISDIWVKLPVTEDAIQIDRVIVRNNRTNPDMEDRFIEIRGIHLPVAHSGLRQIKPLLTEMGYDTLDGHLTCHYRYDLEQKRFSLEKAIIGASQAGDVQISLHMNGISPAGLEKAAGNPLAALTELQNTAMGHASISYSDQSFIQRALGAYSRLSKNPETQITTDLIRWIDDKIKNTQVQSMKNALTALKQFVEQPGFIQIRSEPAEPVFLKDAFLTSMIQGPEALMDLFQIQVSLTP